MNIVNIQHYKTARQYVKDAKIILKVLDLTVRGLSPFAQYKPVSSILNEITNSRTMLEIHLKTANKILNGGTSSEKN